MTAILKSAPNPVTRYNKFGPTLGERLALQTEPFDAAGDACEFHIEFLDGKRIIVNPISWTDQILVCDQPGGSENGRTIAKMTIRFDGIRRIWVKEV